MIGMNVVIGKGGGRLGMFGLGGLILGALRSPPMSLRAFVFHPDLNPFRQGVSGSATLARPNDRLTNVEEHVAVAPFTIRHER